METKHILLSGYYRDSVALMRLSSALSAREGVVAASAQMGSEANIALMVDAGLLQSPLPASPNALLVVVQAGEAETCESAIEFAKTTLDEKETSNTDEAQKEPPQSIAMGMKEAPESNLALISTPGEFAAAEALKALKAGLNVMIFSDGVSVAQEAMLKQYATSHGRVVMGPDCGTAIIGGVPLAFANVIRRGDIGVVGASGTGIQQITTLIHQMGGGITHAIGTGSHDLSFEVGGLTMHAGLKLLSKDEDTKVIVLVSKPPCESVAEEILQAASKSQKPVVVCFLGDDERDERAGITQAHHLEDAALKAIAISKNLKTEDAKALLPNFSKNETPTDTRGRYVRGLFAGGTFCYEAQILLQKQLGTVYSNTPSQKAEKLQNPWKSEGHTFVDLGDDEFTRGKPHPMIDPSTRNDRIRAEAADTDTRIILLDVVLGYGAHESPASLLSQVIREIQSTEAHPPTFVAFVCGTDEDPQGDEHQRALLREAGVLLTRSGAHAATLVAHMLSH